MREHITHHDDCGCKSARYERRIAALREALASIAISTEDQCDKAKADAALAADDKQSEGERNG